MPSLRRRIPSYRLHRPTAQAVVRLDGRDHYLGRHGTPESRQKYDRLIAEWLTARHDRRPAPARSPAVRISVNQLLLVYWEHASGYYRDEDGPSRELDNIRAALRPLRELYGLSPAAEFGPLELEAVRDAMVRAGLARTTVNARVNKVRRVFRWAVAKGLIAPDVLQALQAVEGLKRGRTAAHEPEAVAAVPPEDVEATLPHLPRPVAAMVRIQLLTGCRPEEVQLMRGCDLTPGEPTWEYRPSRHKGKWRGQRRVIPLGPRAQAIVREFLKPDPEAYLFSPRDAVAEVRARRAAARTSKRTPSEQARRRRTRPPAAGARYARVSYGQAVRRACARAGVPLWSPNQLRHAAATLIRSRFGLEAAQVVLGHEKADTTQIYAERDLERAREVMTAVG